MAQQNRADLYLYNWLRRTRLVDDDNLFAIMLQTNNMKKVIMETSSVRTIDPCVIQTLSIFSSFLSIGGASVTRTLM